MQPWRGPLGMTAISPKIASAEFDPEWCVCRVYALYILNFQTYKFPNLLWLQSEGENLSLLKGLMRTSRQIL